MAQALLLPLLERGDFSSGDVFAVVGQRSSIENLGKTFPQGLDLAASQEEKASVVWDSTIQLLAIKPQHLQMVSSRAPQPSILGNDRPVLVSVLAGVSLATLEKSFPGRLCVRAVPNTPALVGQGLTGLSWGSGISVAQKNSVRSLFEPVSEVLELPESQLDAFLALTSSGPAYIALMAEALADGAVAAGLSRSLASHLAHRTLAGTAALLKEKELHPGQLKDMVASPAGTTIEALRVLEKKSVRSAFIEAVIVAAERSKNMS